jgi:hypothetical protein
MGCGLLSGGLRRPAIFRRPCRDWNRFPTDSVGQGSGVSQLRLELRLKLRRKLHRKLRLDLHRTLHPTLCRKLRLELCREPQVILAVQRRCLIPLCVFSRQRRGLTRRHATHLGTRGDSPCPLRSKC